MVPTGESELTRNTKGFRALRAPGAVAAAVVCAALVGGALPTQAAAPVVGDVTVAEGNAGPTTATFTVTGDADSTVGYRTIDGSATVADGDYAAANGELVLDSSGSGTVTVQVNGDTKFEGDEEFSLEITGADGTVTARATITNDDTRPTAKLVPGDVEVAEGNDGSTPVDLKVQLSNASTEQVTVVFTTVAGTAHSDDFDPDPADATLTFEPGQTELPVPVTLQGDTTFEPDETFNVTLKSATKATLDTPATVRVTVKNDDPPPTISVAAASFSEGNDAGGHKYYFDLSLSNPSSTQVQVDVALASGTATLGSDFRDIPTFHTLNFPPGATRGQVPIVVTGDLLDERDETAKLLLSNPVGGTIAAAENPATIVDDDESALTIGDLTVNEPILEDTSTATLVVGLSPSLARDHALTFHYETQPGTATAGADYVPQSGDLTIPPAATSAAILVPINGDDIVDPGETFTVKLTGTNGTPVARSTATVTINEGPNPTLSVADLSVGEGAGRAVLTVKLSEATKKDVKVGYRTVNGPAPAAGAPADYASTTGTLTISSPAKTGTISVPIVDDAAVEADERFTIVVSDPENAVIAAPGQAVVTIRDNDTAPGGGGNTPRTQPEPQPQPVPPPLPPTDVDTKPLGIFLRLPSTTIKIGADGKGTLMLTCPKTVKIGCAGTLKLEVLVRVTAGKTAKLKKILVGTGTYSVKVDRIGKAPIKLTPAGMKLLEKYRRMKVRGLFSSRDGKGPPSVTAAILTLDLQKAKPKAKPKAKTKAKTKAKAKTTVSKLRH